MDTLSYWLARLKPLLTAEEPREVVVVLANRTGVEGDAIYAGTSAVIGIEPGYVKLLRCFGARGEGPPDGGYVKASGETRLCLARWRICEPQQGYVEAPEIIDRVPASIETERRAWRFTILNLQATPN
jgi:hypothetical protein